MTKWQDGHTAAEREALLDWHDHNGRLLGDSGLYAVVARIKADAVAAALAPVERLLTCIDSICEGCEPRRGCSLCELLLAAEPVRAALAEGKGGER